MAVEEEPPGSSVKQADWNFGPVVRLLRSPVKSMARHLADPETLLSGLGVVPIQDSSSTFAEAAAVQGKAHGTAQGAQGRKLGLGSSTALQAHAS